jgi:hypothetical protein
MLHGLRQRAVLDELSPEAASGLDPMAVAASVMATHSAADERGLTQIK